MPKHARLRTRSATESQRLRRGSSDGVWFLVLQNFAVAFIRRAYIVDMVFVVSLPLRASVSFPQRAEGKSAAVSFLASALPSFLRGRIHLAPAAAWVEPCGDTGLTGLDCLDQT